MDNFYIHQGQTSSLSLKAALDQGKIYTSTDITNPAAMMHIIEQIKGREIGCDASKWTKYYPSTLMFERFIRRCREHNVKVFMIHFHSLQRSDIDSIINGNMDIILIIPPV